MFRYYDLPFGVKRRNIMNVQYGLSRVCSICVIGMSVSSGIAQAQNINVTVDGEVVPFPGQPPIEQGGSVLVPLRGVFEKLGASVAYDGATRTILAIKGATSVSLKIGTAIATVNGQQRELSRPAQEVNGTTLVPLRFVSEALGASVKWSGGSRTVIIMTTGVPSQPAPVSGELSATSLIHSANRPLHAGEILTVTLEGSSGGSATFTIPGIEQAKSVAMRETSPGTYVGNLAMPLGINVKNATLLATLRKGSQTAPTLQAAHPIAVDTVGPTVASLSPAPGASLPPGKPLIYGTLSDAGTGINPQNTHILINGKDVTSKATVTEAFISYKPEVDFISGKEVVTIVAHDYAGNETRKQWSFTVAPQESLIKSVSFSPDTRTLEPGDVLTIKMLGKSGGSAKFSVGGAVTNQPMREEPAGTYTGNYTVKKGDSLAKAPVSVALTAEGRTVTQSAEGAINIAAGAPEKPTITSPTAGSSVGDTFTLAGKAKPGSIVRYTVRYAGRLVVIAVSGAIADGEVKANEKGDWSVEGIKLSTPVGVSKITYQVSVVTIGAAGEQSDAVTINFNK